MTSPNPKPMTGVKVSLRTATPRSAATAGLRYVTTVARTGPTWSISAQKRRKADAVQTTARIRTEPSAAGLGMTAGRCTNAIGA